ncbi:hypothetical protein NL676_002665, partial [Syzygium grande]
MARFRKCFLNVATVVMILVVLELCHYILFYNNTDHGVVSVDANWNNTCSTKSNYGTFSSSYDQITLTEAGT